MNENDFREWLKDIYGFTDDSIQKRIGTLNTVSRWMNADIFEISSESAMLDYEQKCYLNQEFIERNTIGHRMYSAALNYYKDFIISTTTEKTAFEKAIETDIEIEEQTEYEIDNDQGEYEGKKKIYFTSRYERSAKNRRDCIEYHGVKCLICGFDFEKVYGEWGKYFIEVHHINPLHRVDEEIVINPVLDLVPVCSNCHRMIHRKKNQVLSIEKIKCYIMSNKKTKEK